MMFKLCDDMFIVLYQNHVHRSFTSQAQDLYPATCNDTSQAQPSTLNLNFNPFFTLYANRFFNEHLQVVYFCFLRTMTAFIEALLLLSNEL